MGILSEIIRLQDLLGDLRPHYARKLEILQSCIYGIDIQPMATEIARLRCFLSLIVDENPSDIKSLPNLEFKFISANSLLPLQTELRDSKGRQLGSDLYESGLDELRQIRLDTFTSHDKDALQSRYQATCDKISQSLFFEAEGETPLTKWKPFNPHNVADFFDSTYMLGIESFDIVIGNPPYIRQESIPNKQAIIQSYKSINFLGKDYAFSCSTADIYTYFFAKSAMLLSPKGNLIFITSNKFCRAGYGKNLREFLLGTTIQKYVDFNGAKVFDNATVDSCILQIYKESPKDNNIAYANPTAKDLSTISYSQIPQDSLSSEAFIFVDLPTLALKQKIERIGTPLKEWDIEINYGIKTGYNEAFIIDTTTRDRILADCDDTDKSRKPFPTTATTPPQTPRLRGGAFSATASGNSESSPSLAESSLSCSPSLARGDSKDSPSLAEGARGWVNLTEKERTAQIIKPILRGRDIKRYSYEWANLWLINTHNGYTLQSGEQIPAIDINNYPALKKHLDKFYPQLEKRTDKGATPYNLRNCAYVEDFGKEKIVYPNMNKEFLACYDTHKFYTNQKCFIVTSKSANLKYLTGIFNSKANFWYFRQIGATLRANGYEMSKIFVEKLPIPKINAKNQKIADKIANLVDKILQSKAQGKDSTTPPCPNATPPCHTTPHSCHTERSEVSQKPHRDLADSLLSAKAKNDKRCDRDFSHFANAQNDKTINDCNDTSNHNRDISPTAQYDKTNKSQYDTSELESQIDKLVYQLYDLDSTEIQIIESLKKSNLLTKTP